MTAGVEPDLFLTFDSAAISTMRAFGERMSRKVFHENPEKSAMDWHSPEQRKERMNMKTDQTTVLVADTGKSIRFCPIDMAGLPPPAVLADAGGISFTLAAREGS